MASYRLIFGIIMGIVLSFLSVFFFNMESILNQIESSELLKAITLFKATTFFPV